MCTPLSGPLRDVHGVIQRRGEGGRRQRWPGGSKREMKRRETDPASNQFPKCSPPSGTHIDSQNWVENEGGGRDRGHLVERKESPKEERVIKPVISLSGKIAY